MKARSAKAKGRKLEKETAKDFENWGWKSFVVPGSGAFDGFPGDVSVMSPDGNKYLLECKNHKSPLKTLRNWMKGCEMLVFKANNEEAWITMTMKTFGEIIQEGRDEPD